MIREQAAGEIETSIDRVPRWDKKLRELWCGEVLVKRFAVPADSQEIILDAFQLEGWPGCIDDPLSWRATGQQTRLRTAIRHISTTPMRTASSGFMPTEKGPESAGNVPESPRLSRSAR